MARQKSALVAALTPPRAWGKHVASCQAPGESP